MILRKNEQVLHTVYHHFLPYVIRCLYFVFFAFITLIFVRFLTELFSNHTSLIYLISFVIFALVFLYMTLIYWFDKLIITNQRLIFINWISITNVHEREINLKDIQDIASFERGLIRFISVLSYGKIVIKSSAYKFDITFEEIGKANKVRTFITRITEYDK